jgi:CubicO group peptidase (beta-lactamase class C family)
MKTLNTGNPEEVGISPERLNNLKQVCENWLNDGSTPALSILAARGGKIFLHEAWGALRPDPDSPPVDFDSLFGMASCSKPVTATAVMTLIDEGTIGLNDPIQEYIPEFKGPETEKITIRHLLSHTSGLSIRTETTILQSAKEGLENPPGTKMVYSNTGYDLLGELIERVSGQPFEEIIANRIFKPLGMENSTFVHVGLDRERCVLGRPGTTYDWPIEDEGGVWASSTLWSTAYDMGLFLQTFLNRGSYGDCQLLSPASVDAMTQNQVRGMPREIYDGITTPPSGYGWFLLEGLKFPNYPKKQSKSSYGHSGASGAFIWVDPEYDLIGAFLFVKIMEEVRPLDVFVDGLMECLIDL